MRPQPEGHAVPAADGAAAGGGAGAGAPGREAARGGRRRRQRAAPGRRQGRLRAPLRAVRPCAPCSAPPLCVSGDCAPGSAGAPDLEVFQRASASLSVFQTGVSPDCVLSQRSHCIASCHRVCTCRARAAGGGATMGDSMHKREENSVRVTNLSEDTREDDLRVSICLCPERHHSVEGWPNVGVLSSQLHQTGGSVSAKHV